MKSTGIVRRVDELGRIVLPIELRRTMDIAEKDMLEIFVEDSSIVLKKYVETCIFCSRGENIVIFHGKNICPDCLRELQELSARIVQPRGLFDKTNPPDPEKE